MFAKPVSMISAEQALPGRAQPMALKSTLHFVNRNDIKPPWPDGHEQALFGMGCFWGAEKLFWQMPGVYVTAVGYAGGYTPNPNYREVCSGQTGHNEVVLVVFNPAETSYQKLLQTFWQGHDPTQYMRQGNDVGTQYRSAIYTYNEAQHQAAKLSKKRYQEELSQHAYTKIKTEIVEAPEFYYAEEDHQQYLAKVPHGYCGLGGTGVGYPE